MNRRILYPSLAIALLMLGTMLYLLAITPFGTPVSQARVMTVGAIGLVGGVALIAVRIYEFGYSAGSVRANCSARNSRLPRQ